MGVLDGKVALITEGASGQGAAEARLFVEEGASVVIGDVQDAARRSGDFEDSPSRLPLSSAFTTSA